MREIVLDTETTGLDPQDGHRIIEIGCVELFNYLPTGRVYQTYINPERDVPEEASAVSGIKTDFLKPFPVFSKIIEEFKAFIGEDRLVIHNAAFDLKFLNAEFERLGHQAIPSQRAVDTLKIARAKFPGSPASLDALCRRFQIDLSGRTKHGAIIDCELLAKVYLELIGGRQTKFEFSGAPVQTKAVTRADIEKKLHARKEPRPHEPSPEELDSHNALVDSIKGSLWKK